MNNKKYDGVLYDCREAATIQEFVMATIKEHPNYTAYMYKKSHKEPFCEVSYGEFGEMREALGTALIGRGFQGSKFAMIGENSYQWALAYFTVVTGAGVAVPLDKGLEREEILNLLRRSDTEVLFSSSKMLGKIAGALDQVEQLQLVVNLDGTEEGEDPRIVNLLALLEEGQEHLLHYDRRYIKTKVKPEDLATILFTSGTTGLAKGVMLSQRNFANNVVGASAYFKAPARGRALSVLPMHHAYEMTCTYLTGFYQGATIVVCEGLRYIQSNFKEAGCSIMLGVPLVFEKIHRKIWKQAEKSGQADNLRRAIKLSRRLKLYNNKRAMRKMFASIHDLFGPELHTFIAGGAAMDPAIINDLEAMGLPMMQGYGMSECAPLIAVTADRYGKNGSVGRPIPGTEVRIIDKDENGIGEIIVRGDSVMMGYYKDPENTAKTILDGWLYTGDYGYLDEDGFLYVTGRKKNVIVTKNGKNIFPEEVEYYLNLDENILESLVYGAEDEAKGDLVCTALIVPDDKLLKKRGFETEEAVYYELKRIVEAANQKMPFYKQVKRIEVRDEAFIKTTTMKIKRFEKENYRYRFNDETFRN